VLHAILSRRGSPILRRLNCFNVKGLYGKARPGANPGLAKASGPPAVLARDPGGAAWPPGYSDRPNAQAGTLALETRDATSSQEATSPNARAIVLRTTRWHSSLETGPNPMSGMSKVALPSERKMTL
jgi:hypothetical protein